MTLVNCSPEWDGNARRADYTWLINHVYEATGHTVKRLKDCGFVSKVNDMRAKEREEPEEEEDMQPYYEVYVENTELDIDDYFGPYDSYEQCVEFINENYTEENINDKDYTFEIQEQEPNGEGSYYAYPDRAIKPGD